MRVAIVSRTFFPEVIGGGEVYIHEIWKRMKKIYHTYLISGWYKNPNLLPKDSYKINQHFLRNVRGLRYFWFMLNSFKAISSLRPHLVHSNCLEVGIKKGIPYVFTVHHLGHLLGKSSRYKISEFSKLYLNIGIQNLKKANKIIVVSNSTKKDILSIMKIDEEKIVVIYNGVDHYRFSPLTKRSELEEIREKYGIEADKFVILNLSRISPEKGQDVAIKAFLELPEYIKKDSLLLVSGFLDEKNLKYFYYLRKLARNQENVLFLTNPRRTEELYKLSDLVIFPTLMFEGFGMIVTEAMSSGKPVIASNFPAIREAGRDIAVYFTPGDYIELSRKISELYEDKKLREKLGRLGRKLVLREFNWDKSFEEHKKVYEEVLFGSK